MNPTESPDDRSPSRASIRNLGLLLLAYFGIQLVLRVMISPSADLDEADQLVLTQKACWGYGPQPPVYTWIQIGFFKGFGLSIFSLALFKNILLFSIYVLTFLNSRFITGNCLCGIASAALLFFLPQVAWESQRDLTHSVLASTLVMVTWYCLLRMRSVPRVRRYVVFGLCAGIGFLSKYNYAVFFVALILAMLSMEHFRPLLVNRRILLAGLVALLVVLPTAFWIFHHKDLTLLTESKFAMAKSGSRLGAIAVGLRSALISTVTFLGPLVLVLGIIFYGRSERLPRVRSEPARLMLRTLGFSYALIVVGVVLFRVTDIRDRWLQPILIYAPVLVTALLQPRLNAQRLKTILFLAAAVMLLVPILLCGRILLAAQLQRTQPLNKPYGELAAQMRESVRDVSLVVTDSRLLAGNLRLNIPDKLFVTPELLPIFTSKQGRYALAWDATKRMEPPESLVEFAQKTESNLTNGSPRYFVAHYKYGDSRQMRLGVIVFPER